MLEGTIQTLITLARGASIRALTRNARKLAVALTAVVGVAAVAAPAASASNYSATILGDGAHQYYRLDESSGTTMGDSSGNSMSGTYSGSPTFGAVGALADETDTATSFGASDGFTAPWDSTDQAATAVTIEFWVKTTSTGPSCSSGCQWWNGGALVDNDVPSTANDFGVTLLNGGIAFGVGNPDTSIFSSAIDDGTWHLVDATWTSGGSMILYIDGQVASSLATGVPSGPRSARSQVFGGPANPVEHDWSGSASLDEIALYDQALSAQAIANHYATGTSPTTTSLSSSPNPTITGQQGEVTYTATVSPTPDGGAVAFTDAGSTIAGCGAQAVDTTTGTATCQVTYDGPGSHTIKASYLGNATYYGASASEAQDETVNNPPDVQIDGGPTGYTNNNQPQFSFSSSVADASFECALAPQGQTPQLSDYASCTSPYAPASALSDGQYTFYVYSSAWGFDGTPASQSFTVDTAAPVLSLNAVASPSTNTRPTFSGTAGTAPGDRPVNLTVFAGRGTSGSQVGPTISAAVNSSTGRYSAQPAHPLAVGTYTVEAAQSDLAGNQAPSQARTFTIAPARSDVAVNFLPWTGGVRQLFAPAKLSDWHWQYWQSSSVLHFGTLMQAEALATALASRKGYQYGGKTYHSYIKLVPRGEAFTVARDAVVAGCQKMKNPKKCVANRLRNFKANDVYEQTPEPDGNFEATSTNPLTVKVYYWDHALDSK